MAKLNSSLGAQSVPGIGGPIPIPGVLGNPSLLAAAQQQAGLLNTGLAAVPPAVIPPPGIAIPQLRAPAQIQPVGMFSGIVCKAEGHVPDNVLLYTLCLTSTSGVAALGQPISLPPPAVITPTSVGLPVAPTQDALKRAHEQAQVREAFQVEFY